MKKSDQLKAERKQKLDAQKGMIDTRNASESKEFTPEERTAFDGLTDSVDALDVRITQAEKDERQEARIASMGGESLGTSEKREHEKLKANYDLHKAIRSQMKNGVLDGVEKEIHEETCLRAREAGAMITGVAVPMNYTEKRADGQTVTQDAGAYGANLVATQTQSPIEFLRPKPILESLGARFMTGLTGDVKFPTNDGGIAGAWEGEVDLSGKSKNAYGSKTMKPNRYAVTTLLSLQNLMQSSVDLQMYTVQDIKAVIANAIDAAGINGPGTGNQPTGILNVSGTNSVVAGTNGLAPTWQNIVDMETGIYSANAEAEKMAYLINPATKGKLKTTKHSAGDLNYLMSTANEINGYTAGVSNLVPGNLTKGTGTNLSAGIYGDFSQLLIGQWAFLDITVDEKSMIDQGYIKLIANTFIDVLVRQPKAFSIVKDWLTA